MPGHRYTAASEEGRAFGNELLDLTRGYEELFVPYGTGVGNLGVLTLVARSRHLLKASYDVADRGDAMVAAITLRSMAESLFVLGWLDEDRELGEMVWMLDEIRTRLSHHQEIAAEERRQRRRARRRGDLVRRLAPGESLGLLERANVRSLKKLQEEVRARVRNLPRLQPRLAKLKVDSINRMPTVEKRAAVSGMSGMYSLVYRFRGEDEWFRIDVAPVLDITGLPLGSVRPGGAESGGKEPRTLRMEHYGPFCARLDTRGAFREP